VNFERAGATVDGKHHRTVARARVLVFRESD
jgi:hypothetical protein